MALATQKLGIKAVIVIPKHTPLIKVEATRKYGAEVILSGEVYDEAFQKAKELYFTVNKIHSLKRAFHNFFQSFMNRIRLAPAAKARTTRWDAYS